MIIRKYFAAVEEVEIITLLISLLQKQAELVQIIHQGLKSMQQMWGEIYILMVSAFIGCFLKGISVQHTAFMRRIMYFPTCPSWT